MGEFWLILGMMVVTFAARYPILALVGRFTLPGAVQRALRYVPPAVLSALIAPAVFFPDGEQLMLGLDNVRLLAAALAALVSWRTKNLLWTILIGMAAFWVFGLLW